MKISISKCLAQVGNRFDLCMLGSYRARLILASQNITSGKCKKPSILALKEIEDGKIDISLIHSNILEGMRSKSNSPSKEESSSEDSKAKPEVKKGLFAEENIIED